MGCIGAVTKTIMKLWDKRGIVLNYWKRPKLLIEFKADVFDFSFLDGGRRTIDLAYISIKNNEDFDVTIVSNSLMLETDRFPTGGGELLKWLYDNSARPVLPATHEIMYDHYNIQGDHLNISSGRSTFKINPGHTKIFPIVLFGAAINTLFSKKNNSNLILKKGLMSVTLNVNQKVREYGFDREIAYKYYLNYIAAYTAKFPPVIKEIQSPYFSKKLTNSSVLKREWWI